MSQQYPGGLITKNPVVPSGPYQNSTASGVWTLDQAAQYKKADNWPTAGNLPNYIEDVFSTYLYTGNASTQTITNGIDLSGKGGLVWFKKRSGLANNGLFSSADGFSQRLFSDLTNAYNTPSPALNFVPLTTGFSINSSNSTLNESGSTFASWTFRKQAKFFDVVTWTGDGTNRTIAHNLGSVPGCIVVKRVDATANWAVYHRSLANTQYMSLNLNSAVATGATFWNSTTPTSTVFSLGTDAAVNASGGTYVAYIFAHDAGGFGLSGTDNVISCGSYTGNGSANGPIVTLGYEPQWLIIKEVTTNNDWQLLDSMRGLVVGGADAELNPNSSDAESSGTFVSPLATGFRINTTAANYNANGSTYIYIAIRRGPMKVPTSGTQVFSPLSFTASSGTRTTNFPVDLQIVSTTTSGSDKYVLDRLRGVATTTTGTSTPAVFANLSNLESSSTTYTNNWSNTGYSDPSMLTGNAQVNWNFRRAPGFFDEVCYTGTGSATTFTHNLAAVPELMLVKRRSTADSWQVYIGSGTEYLILNSTAAKVTGNSNRWNSTTPTSSVFSVGSSTTVNASGSTYVAYLFATVVGVSKVGSYTGTGTTQVINCGFTAGSRFVLIKRTDSTGDWYVWDSARGIVAGNDPYLLLNTVDPQVTSTDYVDTAATGFEISSTAPAAINANGGTFIFLAIA